MPHLSIVVATYNSGKTLRSALESVFTQTFQNWECIIVDGASSDDTLEIAKEYVARDQRFRYISESDNGIYDAFNKGWKMAGGEWIHYLGSDDRLVQDGFQKLFSQDIDADMIGGGVYLVRNGERDKLQYTQSADGCHQGFIVKKEVIDKLGGFDESYKIAADKDLLVRIATQGYRVINYKIPIAYFYIGGVSQKFSSLTLVNIERYKIYKRNYYKQFPLVKCICLYFCSLGSIIRHILCWKR